MLEILLIIIIILLAPLLIDVVIGLVTLSFVYAAVILITLSLVILYGNYPLLINRIMMSVFVLSIIIGFIKDVIDGYNGKD